MAQNVNEAARRTAAIMRREAAKALDEAREQRSRNDLLGRRNDQLRQRVRERFPARFAQRTSRTGAERTAKTGSSG